MAAPKPPKRKSADGVRLFPAVMATGAALLGLKAFTMAESLAQTTPAADHAQTATAAPAAPGGPATAQTPATPATATTQCTPTLAQMAGLSQSEVEVLQALGARRQSLDARATQIETQDDVMSAAERRLDERVAQLRQLETTVNGLLGQLDQAQETRLAALVDVYQRMRAKDAANVFNTLDDTVAIQVASRMRQTNLAEVMGRMQPDRARHLTEMLADRARPPSGGQDLLSRAGGAAPSAPATTAAAGAPGQAAGH